MEHAAGVILLKRIDPELRVLCLRIYGHYDLPKGRLEDGETALAGALRETLEESGIGDIKFPYGYINITIKHPKRAKSVTFFLGMTDKEARILQNPVTGKFEHHDVSWLTLDDAEKKVHAYLRPAITWAKKELLDKNGS